MRIRASHTLVFSLQANAIVAFNYLTNSTFECDADLLSLLSSVGEWSDFATLQSLVPGIPCDELESTLQSLIDADAIVEEGSPLAAREAEVAAGWKWGIPAALFHFSIQDRQHMTPDATEDLQREKIASAPAPVLYLKNDPEKQLPLPSAGGDELLRLMARRRTNRNSTLDSLSLQQLSDCLFAGMGITGETENCVGTLPLSMTPSGGARNPFEAYVYSRSIDGLAPGFYHYSAAQHSLERVNGTGTPKPSEFLGGQDWADAMPCVIILCAFFERSMWKYDDANAYRVVMIEAGHIGQNIMLAATQHGLSACPTAALNHSAIQQLLGTKNKSTQSPTYALTLGHPARAE